MATFGAIDYSGPDRLRRAFEGFNQNDMATKVNAIGVLKDREQQSQASAVVQRFFGENIFDKSEKEILNASTKAATELGTIGGQHAQAGAQQIYHGIELYTKLKPKQDVTQTPEEAYFAGKIDLNTFRTMKGFDKNKTAINQKEGYNKKGEFTWHDVIEDPLTGKTEWRDTGIKAHEPSSGDGSGSMTDSQMKDVFIFDKDGKEAVGVNPKSTPAFRKQTRTEAENRRTKAEDKLRKLASQVANSDRRTGVAMVPDGVGMAAMNMEDEEFAQKYGGKKYADDAAAIKADIAKWDRRLTLLNQFSSEAPTGTTPTAPKQRGSGF